MDFLQSEEWRKFQEAVGRRTFLISDSGFHASIIEHELPLVGKYFYIPRGIIFNFQFSIFNQAPIFNDQFKNFFPELISLAKKENAGWIRFDASDSRLLDLISLNSRVVKAPHDMQPKEIFVIDISKPEEELLAEMKAKTRYNIKLSQKHNVSVKAISNFQFPISNQIQNQNDKNFKYYLDELIKLVKITAERDKITPHPEEYYRQMFEVIPEKNIKLYVAEYENKVIAANIVIFFGDTAIYLHGASDNEYRNVMAPYLLQWKQICDAKLNGCVRYDMGGVKTKISNFEFRISNQIPNSNELNFDKLDNLKLKHSKVIQNSSGSWSGITKFKTGFSPNTNPLEFLGSYDIVINPMKYRLYRIIQRVKSML